MDLMEVPSHITAPKGIELKPSEVDSTQMGAWATTFIPKGSVYGPFVGEVVYEHNDKKVDYRFAWEVYNLDTSELLHIVNATDARKGNWMRYVNCARFLEEQNFVSVQEGLKVYYKAIKDVKPGEELLTWFEPFKKKRRRRKKNSVDSNSSQESTTATPSKKEKNKGSKPPTPQHKTSVQQISPPSKPVAAEPEILDRSKRQRKKKKLFDEEILLTDLVFKKSRHRRTREEIERDELEAKLNPKVKVRKRRKKSSVDNSPLEKFESQGTPNTEERVMGDECESSIGGSLECLEMVDGKSAETLESSWTYPDKKFEYQFDMQSHFGSHITQNGRRMYRCDVCSGIYRHTFSLKRHYLRNHINCKYLSKTDIANCMIVIGQQQLAILKSNSKATLQKIDQALCTDNDAQKADEIKNLKNIKTEPGTEESFSEIEKTSFNSSTMEDNIESNGAKDDLDSIKKEVDDVENMSDVSSDKKVAVSMPGLYKCNICYRLFDVVENLKCHTQDHPPVPDVKGFACDKCHMRFTYKQNLVRHHLVHEKEEPQKKEEKKKSPVKKGAPPVPALRDVDGKPVVHKPFRCSKCPMRFRYQVNLDRHEAIHDADRPYICSYCGKAFPTVTNMKKHEHVHLGSKVPCKYCTAIFVHVGSLRKHIRLEHPDIHRQRLLKLLEKRGKLGTKAAKSLQESYHQDKVSTTVSPVVQAQAQEPPKKEKRAAQSQEIDTKFKFACVICKKRFTAYVNMCRHRRLAHKEEKVEPKPQETKSPSKTFSVKSLLNINKKGEEPIQFDTANDPIDDSPEANAQFYANVAANIAENLNCYIDGGVESLSNYKDHILIENFDSKSPEEYKESLKNDSSEFSWESFNFPKNYNPKLLDNNFVDFSECPVPVKEERMDDVTDSMSFEHRAPALCTRRRSSLEGLSSCESSRDGLENQHHLKIKKEPVTPTKQDGSNGNTNLSPAVTDEEAGTSAQEKQNSADAEAHDNPNIDINQSKSCKTFDGKMENADAVKDSGAAGSFKKSEICRTKSTEFEDKTNEKGADKESHCTKYILKLPLLCSKSVESNSHVLNTDSKLQVLAPELGTQHSKQEVESSENSCEKRGDLKDLVEYCGEKDEMFGKHNEMEKHSKEKKNCDELEGDCDLGKNDEKLNNSCANNEESDSCGDGANCEQSQKVKEICDNSGKNKDKGSCRENNEIKNNSANKGDEIEKTKSCENILKVNINDVGKNLQDEEDKLKCDEILEEDIDEISKKQSTTAKQTVSVTGPADATVGLVISDVKSGDDAMRSWFTENHEDDNISGCSSPGVYNPPLSSDSDSDMDAETYQRNLNTEILLQGLHLAKTSNSATDLVTRESSVPSTEKIYRNLLNMNVTVNDGIKSSPKHSPFHEFEAIAFGKHGKPAYVCAVCKKHFSEFESMLRHQWKKHPSLACHFLEVEQGHEIEYLYYPDPCNVGVLGASGKSLEKIADRSNYICTRCKGSFKSVDRLRIHIINCAPKPDVTEPVSLEKHKRRRRRFAKKILGVEHLQRDSDVKPKQRSTSIEAKPKKLFLQSPRKRKTSDQIEVPENLGPAKVKRKRSYDIGYNPGNHVRRREMTEVLDRHQCKGCGVKFKSISLLERHVKKCDGKDKFKDLKVIKSTVNESFHQKMKHTCLYCTRGFAYPKTLMNHYKAFCVVKKEKITMGTLTMEEREQEAAMMVRLKQQDDDRNEVVTVYDSTEGNRKGWPKGMKRKARRKNHCWTYIKKRKSSNDGDSPTNIRYTPSNDGDSASNNGRYTPSNDSKSTDSDRYTPSDDLDTPSNRGVTPSNDGEILPELESCSGPGKIRIKIGTLAMESSDQHLQKQTDASDNDGNKGKNVILKPENNIQTVEQQSQGQPSEVKGQVSESKEMNNQVKYIPTVTKSTNGSMLVTIRPVVGVNNATESTSGGTGGASVGTDVSCQKVAPLPVHSATQTAVKQCSAKKSQQSTKSTPEIYTKFSVVPLKSDANSCVVPQVLKIPKPTTEKSGKNNSVIKSEISSKVKSSSENVKNVVKSPLRGRVQKSDIVESQDKKVDSVGGNKKGKKKKNKGKGSQDTVVEAVPLDKELQKSLENSSHLSVGSDISETTNDAKTKKVIKKQKRRSKDKEQNNKTEGVQSITGEVQGTSRDTSSPRPAATFIESAVKANKAQVKKQMLESEKKVESDGNSRQKKTRTPKKKDVVSEKEEDQSYVDGDKDSNKNECKMDNNTSDSSNNKPSVESPVETRITTPVKSSPKKKKVDTVDFELENSHSNAKLSPKRKKKIQSVSPDQCSDNQKGNSVGKQKVTAVANDLKNQQQSVLDDIPKNSDGKVEKVTPTKKGNKKSLGVKVAEENVSKPRVPSSVTSPLSKASASTVNKKINTNSGVDNVKCNLNSVFSEDVLSEDATAVQLLTSLKGTERYPQCNSVQEVRNSDRRAVTASNMAIEDPLSPVSNLLQLAQVAADVLSGVVSMVEDESSDSSSVKQVIPNKMTPGGRSANDVHGKSDSTDSEMENGQGRKTPSKKKRVSKSPMKLTTRAELMTKLDL